MVWWQPFMAVLVRVACALCVLAAVWAAVVAWTGGFLVQFGTLRISSRNPWNPALASLLTAFAAWLLSFSSEGRAALTEPWLVHGVDGVLKLCGILWRKFGLETLSASERFIVATLEAENARWNVPVQEGRPDDVTYVSDVIDRVSKQVCTDDTRVYATGFSGGARMSSLLACKLGSRLAAIAPVSGSFRRVWRSTRRNTGSARSPVPKRCSSGPETSGG